MPQVEISGWRPGFEKVACTKTLQSAAGLGLAEAKQVTDAVLAGLSRTVDLPSTSKAEQLATTLTHLGAIARVVAAT